MDSNSRTITSSLNSLPASSQFPAQPLLQKSLRQPLLPVFSVPAAPNYTNCSSLSAQLSFSDSTVPNSLIGCTNCLLFSLCYLTPPPQGGFKNILSCSRNLRGNQH